MQEDCTTTNKSVQTGNSNMMPGGDGCWKIYQLRHKNLLTQKKNDKNIFRAYFKKFPRWGDKQIFAKPKKSVDTTYTFLLIFMNAKENHDINTKIWISWLLKIRQTITVTLLLFVFWSRFYFNARKQTNN